MIRRLLTAVVLAALVGCSGSAPTDLGASGGSTGGGSTGGGTTGGGTTGGGSTGGGTGGGTTPLTAAVVVGNIFFKSGLNGSVNPAVDTVAAGGTVTWTWTNSGNVPHTVESLSSAGFTSSDVLTGDGSTHRVTFTTPGTYQYDCAVHGTMMRGTIVVR
jgi:plastocyanin